jgi:hypothetical protein
MITDAENKTLYKVYDKEGRELAVRPSQMLADMYIGNLPDELKEGCYVVPITDDGKQILFG